MDDKSELFGKRLKSLRNKRKVNQEDIATAIGISRARYSHYENNHVEPDIELIRKLADYHDVTTDYLLGKSNRPRLTEEKDKQFNELQAIIYNMPEEKQNEMKERILAYAKGLTDANND